MAEANNLQWAVVEFTSSETVATVPIKWIDKRELTCLWPTNKLGSKIRRMADPDESWECHAVRIVTKTASYQDGRVIEKKMSDCDTEGETYGDPTKRAKKKKLTDFVSDFETGNEPLKYSEKFVSLKDVPRFPKKNYPIIENNDSAKEKDKTYPIIQNTDSSKEKDKTLGTSLFPLNPPKNTLSDVGYNSKEDFSETDQAAVDELVERTRSGCSSNDTLSIPDDELMPPPFGTPTVQNKQAEETSNIDCCCKHGRDIKNILKVMVNVKVALEEQNRIIEVNMSSKNIGENSMKITNFDTVPKKPFISYKKLMLYEDKLKINGHVNIQLETVLYLCGGTSPKEAIKRGLGKIFSDKLARRCSWTGRKNNLPLKTLRVMEIIKTAVRKRFSVLCDKEFETIVSTWFRQAELRYERAQGGKVELK